MCRNISPHGAEADRVKLCNKCQRGIGLQDGVEWILFTIDPITGSDDELIFDGGEIWLWDGITPGSATFLSHGGHTWDTAFDVMGTFGVDSDDVNALESVWDATEGEIPEPVSVAFLGAGLLGLERFKGSSFFDRITR